MANRDTILLSKLITEVARRRRTDRRGEAMLAVIETQQALYAAGYAYTDSPSPERAAALEDAALAHAAASFVLASDGCEHFRFAPSQAAKSLELAHAS